MTLGLILSTRPAGSLVEVYEPRTGRVLFTGTRRQCDRWLQVNG